MSNVGYDTFFPKRPSTKFVVKNIARNGKTVRVFNYPILNQQTRDLLAIPGVSEADIRHSLLKGSLAIKLNPEIKELVVVESDIDLLQFNFDQKAFLTQAGITVGLEVSDGVGMSAKDHQTIRQLIHFIENGPADGFASGAVREIFPKNNPYPTAVIWYLDGSKTTKLVEKLTSYNGNNMPIIITHNLYDVDGATIIHSITDSISYTNNIFESVRTRAIV